MKRLLILLMLLMVSCPAWAGIIQFDSKSEFINVLKVPYLFEDFEDYGFGTYFAPSLVLNDNGYEAELSARRKLFSLIGSMTSNYANDPLIIDFNNSPTPVTAIGGVFWPTGWIGEDTNGYVRITLSDGTLHDVGFDSANSDTFLGFATDGSPFQRLEVKIVHETIYDPTWPTVDNLYIGSDPFSVPEPSSFLLIALGLCLASIVFWRKEA
jgi:hypothetical protein